MRCYPHPRTINTPLGLLGCPGVMKISAPAEGSSPRTTRSTLDCRPDGQSCDWGSWGRGRSAETQTKIMRELQIPGPEAWVRRADPTGIDRIPVSWSAHNHCLGSEFNEVIGTYQPKS